MATKFPILPHYPINADDRARLSALAFVFICVYVLCWNEKVEKAMQIHIHTHTHTYPVWCRSGRSTAAGSSQCEEQMWCCFEESKQIRAENQDRHSLHNVRPGLQMAARGEKNNKWLRKKIKSFLLGLKNRNSENISHVAANNRVFRLNLQLLFHLENKSWRTGGFPKITAPHTHSHTRTHTQLVFVYLVCPALN